MRVLVLGIGNVLLGDEGVGVFFTNYLEKNYEFDFEVSFVDGGTLAMALTPIIASFDKVLVVDCIDAKNSKPGEVYFFNFDDIPKVVSFSGSAHEVEMLQTLTSMALLGDLPDTHILGVVPKRVELMGAGLSSEVVSSLEILEKTALKFLKSFGNFRKTGNFSLEDIAKNYENEILTKRF